MNAHTHLLRAEQLSPGLGPRLFYVLFHERHGWLPVEAEAPSTMSQVVGLLNEHALGADYSDRIRVLQLDADTKPRDVTDEALRAFAEWLAEDGAVNVPAWLADYAPEDVQVWLWEQDRADRSGRLAWEGV